ncbi:MAG TPA: tetratricopeptide repeat protein [Tenuifilaceae bacterium]|nr:tetratricopeptide repeat protein [Tenuifilaceae bacterium]HPE17974.1 tetratricopeptide repeat protein [Tenuifilaceae bacterium]HPJ44904.1 tetratricopeptide repeat protein [Tenuifilaceae bacterium]HPQ33130.1 tetratricopeptide repeat protein [Tenuifilaceae bacterium]HRX67062.1 tetratricopeptide repeat protein [Tenuifilaceae bacterium]
MAKNKKETTEPSVEALENALTRTEQYIENNQKSLTIIVLAIIVIVGLFIGYKRLYIAPMEKDAQAEIFAAEQYFEKDSFNLALNGDGNYLGFLGIIDNYGPSRTGNLAYYYAGICYRNLGEYETAIDYLKRYSIKDEMLGSITYGAIGDCYVQLNNLEEGVSNYMEAANYEKNDFSTPVFLMKAGLVYEKLGKMDKALEVYKQIKKDFPKSSEAREVEKHIARVETSL